MTPPTWSAPVASVPPAIGPTHPTQFHAAWPNNYTSTKGVSGGWHAWPFGVQIGAIAAVILALVGAGIAVAFSAGGGAGGSGRAAESSAIATASTMSDWVASVCAKSPTHMGPSALPNSVQSEQCFSANGNPILIGMYPSTAAMQDDIGQVPYDAPYATMVDDSSGAATMFVAL